jgi:hypothetical protein
MPKFYIFNLERPKNKAVAAINADSIEEALPKAIAIFQAYDEPAIGKHGEDIVFTWYERFLLTASPSIPVKYLTN